MGKGKLVKMTSKVNLRKKGKWKRVVAHFYLVLDTCKYPHKPNFALDELVDGREILATT
jgi:hypothetical protein